MADVLLDACCLINLFSSGRATEILRGLRHKWHVCEAVSDEVLFVDEMVAGKRERKMVDLQPLVSAGLLTPCAPSALAEMELFVQYAARLDDGEAMCLALGKCRSWTVATDERKGRRIAAEDGIAIVNTLQVIRSWVESQTIESKTVREVIANVTTLGRFKPGADAPSADWWRNNGGTLSG